MKTMILIAACNEAASLKKFLPRLVGIVKNLNKVNILLVSDGSTDKTAEVAKRNGCDVIINHRNLGIGESLRIGYRKAIEENYDCLITMDADGQHDEKLIPKFITSIERDEADIIIGSRYHKDSKRIGVPIDRDLLNVSVVSQMRIVTGWETTDPLSGFWVMTRPYFKFCYENSKQKRYGIHLENLIKLWYLYNPRPRKLEVPHPAIYTNHGTLELLTRDYSAANQEQRVERFGTHALHILESLEDVKSIIGDERVNSEIEERIIKFREGN